MDGYRIDHYLTADGAKDLYADWLRRLRDGKAKVAVIRRVARIEQGNFGDHRFCRDGVWELRVDVGPGYRVYYAMSGHQVVRSEEHTSELQSLMRISYAVFCLKKKKHINKQYS